MNLEVFQKLEKKADKERSSFTILVIWNRRSYSI